MKHSQIFFDKTGLRFKIILTISFILVAVLLSLIIPFSNFFKLDYSIANSFEYSDHLLINEIPFEANDRNVSTVFSIFDEKGESKLKQNNQFIDTLYFDDISNPFIDNNILIPNYILKNTTKGIDNIYYHINNYFYDTNVGKIEYKGNPFSKESSINKAQYLDSIIDTLKKYKLTGVSLDFDYNSFDDKDFSVNTISDTLKQNDLKLVTFHNLVDKPEAENLDIFTISDNVVFNLYQEKEQNSCYFAENRTKEEFQTQYNKNELSSLELIKETINKNSIENYSFNLPSKQPKYNENFYWQCPITYSSVQSFWDSSDKTFTEDKKIEISRNEPDNAGYKIKLNDSVYYYNLIIELEAKDLKTNNLSLNNLSFADPIATKFLKTDDEDILNLLASQFVWDYNVETEGEGYVFDKIRDFKYGTREITLNNDYITGFEIKSKSIPSKVVKSGFEEKKVHLTFDDGPNPEYTPKILDILAENNIKATFYVIGKNAQSHPLIVQRIVNEGHTLANHTNTHRRSLELTNEQFNKEIQITRDIIHNITKEETRLFRIPFNEVGNVDTEIDTKIIDQIQKNNLITSQFDIDSKDFESNSADEVYNNVFKDIEKTNGGQILFHDLNSQAKYTTEALPRIINELKNRGFEIQSADDLIRKEVTPKDATNWYQDIYFAITNFAYYSFLDYSRILILICLILGLIIVVVGAISFIYSFIPFHKRKKEVENFDKNFNPLVSILIPLYNEEKVVCNTIDSLLQSTYKNFEVIVIDDGSKDNSWQVIQDRYFINGKSKLKNLRAYTKENGGKASALNYGIEKANGEIVVSLDADTMFTKESIYNLTKHFNNPKVGAVAGNVVIGNETWWLTKCQQLEYILGQTYNKRGYDAMNAIMVVPGAIGAFRKQIVKDVGMYTTDTLAEDTDLTIRVLNAGWVIRYEPCAQSITEAPDDLKSFWKQRFRWQFGTLQVLFKYKKSIFSFKNFSLGFIALPLFLINFTFVALTPFTNAVILISFIRYILAFFVGDWINISQASSILPYFIVFILYILFEFIILAVSIYFDNSKGKWYLLRYIPINNLIYKNIIIVVTLWAMIKALQGQAQGWGHLARKGTVKLENNDENEKLLQDMELVNSELILENDEDDQTANIPIKVKATQHTSLDMINPNFSKTSLNSIPHQMQSVNQTSTLYNMKNSLNKPTRSKIKLPILIKVNNITK